MLNAFSQLMKCAKLYEEPSIAKYTLGTTGCQAQSSVY